MGLFRKIKDIGKPNVEICQRIPNEAAGLVKIPISIDLKAKNDRYFQTFELQTYLVSKETTEEDLKEFCVIDVETTSLDNVVGDIVEVSAVQFRNGKPVSFFSTLINPQCRIPTVAQDINGITPQMVATAPTFSMIKDSLQSYINRSKIIVGHNVSFDIRFLSINGIKFDSQKKYFCTLANAKNTIKNAESYRLGSLCKLLNIPLTAHNSLSDSIATGHLLWALMQKKRNTKTKK